MNFDLTETEALKKQEFEEFFESDLPAAQGRQSLEKADNHDTL